MSQNHLRAWGLNGRHVDEGRATTQLGWSTTTHERVKGARIVPRGNAPKNAWWIGCTTKIVVALQKNAANVVGCENTNIDMESIDDYRISGRMTILRLNGSGAANKTLDSSRRGRATAATTSQAAAEGRPNRDAVAAQRYLEVRLPRFYGAHEQL